MIESWPVFSDKSHFARQENLRKRELKKRYR